MRWRFTRYLEFAQRQPAPLDVQPWLEKIATIVDRLEEENAEHPDRYVVRQKVLARDGHTRAAGRYSEDASDGGRKRGSCKRWWLKWMQANPLKYYQLSQARMNAALYHSYCGRMGDAVHNAEISLPPIARFLSWANTRTDIEPTLPRNSTGKPDSNEQTARRGKSKGDSSEAEEVRKLLLLIRPINRGSTVPERISWANSAILEKYTIHCKSALAS